MQMIEAVIKPHKLDAVKTALAKLGILGVTAVECKGFGRQMGHTERYRGAKMDVGFVPKVLLKICVKSDETAKAVDAIVEAAAHGRGRRRQDLRLPDRRGRPHPHRREERAGAVDRVDRVRESSSHGRGVNSFGRWHSWRFRMSRRPLRAVRRAGS